MSTGLCVIFNHPFREQLPLLRDLYRDRFEKILFLHPLDPAAAAPDVHIVYGGGFTFDQMASQARDRILATFDGFDAVLFAHNDLLLSPKLSGDRFMVEFGMDRSTILVPGMGWVSECLAGWHHGFRSIMNWAKPHDLFGSGGYQSKSFLPPVEFARSQARAFGLNDRTTALPVPPEILTKMPVIFQAVHETVFGSGDTPPPYEMGHPLFQGYSDFFAIGADLLEPWFHNLGILASMSLFSEVAIPTASVLTAKRLITLKQLGRQMHVLWAQGRDVVDDIDWIADRFAKDDVFIHPVKYNYFSEEYLKRLRGMYFPTVGGIGMQLAKGVIDDI